MKKLLFLLLLVCTSVASATPKNPLERIEPLCWYAGMNNPSLQLMLYGRNIGQASVGIDYAGARLDSLVRLDNPNYLLVYLNLDGAPVGTLTLHLQLGKRRFDVPYELRQRERTGQERHSFTNADVLYQLMPDRFSSASTANDQIGGLQPYTCRRSDPALRHGGDLEGIRRRLDYFASLGVTALWFTPVLENNSPDREGTSTYHGYAPTDFYHIDPRFGTNQDYRQLTDEAHQHGLLMVMDMIFNHCGFEHPWVSEIPSADWFNNAQWLEKAKGLPTPNDLYRQTTYQLTPVRDPYAADIDLEDATESWFVPTMPDLNQHNPHVLRYLIQSSKWWIETIGIDGIRMDTYPYAFADAMSQWMRELNDEYPHFNVVGEAWVEEPAYTASWQKGFFKDNPSKADQDSWLPTVMDFSLFRKLRQATREDSRLDGQGFHKVYQSLVYDFLYPDPTHVLAFLDNHDTDRYMTTTADTLLMRQAYALLLTLNRIPQLYYGDEILLCGTKEKGDGYVRQDFPGGFPGDRHNAFNESDRTAEEQSMVNFLSRLLHWRKGNRIITEGSQKQFMPCQGVYALAREWNGHTVLTLLNGSPEATTLPIERYKEVVRNRKTAHDVLTDTSLDLTQEVVMPPHGALILEF